MTAERSAYQVGDVSGASRGRSVSQAGVDLGGHADERGGVVRPDESYFESVGTLSDLEVGWVSRADGLVSGFPGH